MSEVSAKALIMVVSRPDAAERAVERLSPEAVAVISSQEVLGEVVVRCQSLKGRARFLYGIVDSPMEIEDAFGRFERLLSELENIGYAREDIALDATGGTAPMKIGAALAAMTHGMRMIHQRVPQSFVDGEWRRDESKEIEVVPMDNPLESTGLLREGQAIELFNRRDYSAAALVFHDVAEKVSGVERGHYYKGLMLLSEGYAAWDVADYTMALDKLRAAREELGVGFSEAALAERASEVSGGIKSHLGFLGKVRGKLSVENVVDMVENARRRIEDQGRHDDGVARLYRAVEMFHQWRLLEHHSISAKKVEWEKVDGDLKKRFLEAANLEALPEYLDLTRARCLDHILGGESQTDDNVLRDLLRQRNNSILAHGLEHRIRVNGSV
ncbi:MAG: TIGR02710 family CRISPR-associated CARF protein, partial [Rubrobacteraceae bacterium]